MKYYKIVNPYGHHGLVYHEGLNTDPLPFNPSGDCDLGGIYFSREDIFAFLDYGTELYEVEPVGEIYKNPCMFSKLKKWKTHEVKLTHIGKVLDNIPFLVEQGANVHAYGECALRLAANNGRLDAVKYLVENGADMHVNNNRVLSFAASNGCIDVVKYLIEQGANIHAYDDEALRWAASNGCIDVVKYLIEQGANIHAYDDEALRYAVENGHTEVVEYLKSLIL